MALCDWGQHCDGSARFGTQLKSRWSSCFARLKASAAKLIASNFSPHCVDFVAKAAANATIWAVASHSVFFGGFFHSASRPEEHAWQRCSVDHWHTKRNETYTMSQDPKQAFLRVSPLCAGPLLLLSVYSKHNWIWHPFKCCLSAVWYGPASKRRHTHCNWRSVH